MSLMTIALQSLITHDATCSKMADERLPVCDLDIYEFSAQLRMSVIRILCVLCDKCAFSSASAPVGARGVLTQRRVMLGGSMTPCYLSATFDVLNK